MRLSVGALHDSQHHWFALILCLLELSSRKFEEILELFLSVCACTCVFLPARRVWVSEECVVPRFPIRLLDIGVSMATANGCSNKLVEVVAGNG